MKFHQKHFLLIVLVLTLAVSIAAAGLAIWLDREQTRAATEERLLSLAEMQENQTIAWIRVAELILNQMEEVVAGGPVEGRRHILGGRLRTIAVQSSDIESLWIATPDGRLAADSVGINEPVDVSDREFFTSAMTAPGLHIAPMILGRFTNNWVVTISRRLSGPDGSAIAVIAASIHASTFDRYYQGTGINGPRGTHTVVHENGSLIFRSPLPDQEMPSGMLRSQVLILVGTLGVGTVISPFDGVKRLYAWRRFADFPLVTASAVAVEDVYRDWRERSLIIIIVALCWTLLLALLGSLAWRAQKREEETRRRAAAAEARHMEELVEQRDAAIRAEQNKAVLLNELHHRVKNNLQILSSLAMMQKLRSRHLGSEFDSFTARIEAMAKVHQFLSHADDIEQIEFRSYAEGLCRDLIHASGRDEIRVETRGRALLSLETATPIGIILNELLTNILKYSFDPGRAGTISLEVRQDGSALEIRLADDGAGREIPRRSQRSSLGLLLVERLLQQVGARMEIRTEPGIGASWTITLQVAHQPMDGAVASAGG